MDNLIIEKILGVDLYLLTNDGKHHVLSLMDFIGNNGSSILFDSDDNRVPRYKIDIHLECDEYTFGLDCRGKNI